jgi:DNA-binding MarR family transcriptional regulator
VRIATCFNLLMREARRRISERWNLTLPQFDVLAELARANGRGATFAELSRLLVATSGNLTGIVARPEIASQRNRPGPSRP